MAKAFITAPGCALLDAAGANRKQSSLAGDDLPSNPIHLQTLRAGAAGSEQEEVQVAVTRVLVDSYFDIVRKNLQDAVPKARHRKS